MRLPFFAHCYHIPILLQQGVALCQIKVVLYHLFYHLLQCNLWHPSKVVLGFCGVTEEGFDLCGAEVAFVDADYGLTFGECWVVRGHGFDEAFFVDPLPFPADGYAELCGCHSYELPYAVLNSCSYNIVFGFVLLEHHPLHADIVFCVAPVAFGIYVAHVKALFKSLADVGKGTGDLSGDEGFSSTGGFMVEKDAVAGVHAVGFTVVLGDPVSVELGYSVRAAWVERSGFLLGGFLYEAVKFTCACLVEPCGLFKAEEPDGFKQAQGAEGVDIGGVLRRLETDGYMALGGEVVYLVGFCFSDDAREVAAVGKVAVVENEVAVVDMRILIEMVYALGVEGTGAPFDAVDFVAFFKKEFS